MFRPQCSYWIDITGSAEAIKEAESALGTNPVIQEAFFKEVNEYGDIHYEISDGTIEQWIGVDDELAKVAALVPGITMTVEEIDEECNKFHIIWTFTDGKLFSVQHGRQLAPDQYDQETANFCIKLLTDAGMTKAAKFLKGKYIGV